MIATVILLGLVALGQPVSEPSPATNQPLEKPKLTDASSGAIIQPGDQPKLAKQAKAKTAKDVVESFYKQYLEVAHPTQRKSLSMAFSRGMHKLFRDNERLCRQKAGTDLCGWNASGDTYLDAQEYEQTLTVKSTGLTVTEISPGKINVKLNVYPSMADQKEHYDRDITYLMIKEVSEWVIADIQYKGRSLREEVKKENESLRKRPNPGKPKEMHKEKNHEENNPKENHKEKTANE